MVVQDLVGSWPLLSSVQYRPTYNSLSRILPLTPNGPLLSWLRLRLFRYYAFIFSRVLSAVRSCRCKMRCAFDRSTHDRSNSSLHRCRSSVGHLVVQRIVQRNETHDNIAWPTSPTAWLAFAWRRGTDSENEPEREVGKERMHRLGLRRLLRTAARALFYSIAVCSLFLRATSLQIRCRLRYLRSTIV